MRSVAITYPALLLVAVVAACDVSPRGAEDEPVGTQAMMTPAEVDAALNQVRPQFIQTYGSGARASTGMPAMYTPDAVYSDPDGETHSGRAAVQEAYADGLPAGATLRISSFGAVGSGDLIVDMGRYTIELPQPGGTAVQQNGRYMLAVQRMDDGSWKIVRQLSAPLPAGAPPVPDSAAVGADSVARRDTAAMRDTSRAGDTTAARADSVRPR